jgi:hypothetical protein
MSGLEVVTLIGLFFVGVVLGELVWQYIRPRDDRRRDKDR